MGAPLAIMADHGYVAGAVGQRCLHGLARERARAQHHHLLRMQRLAGVRELCTSARNRGDAVRACSSLQAHLLREVHGTGDTVHAVGLPCRSISCWIGCTS